MFATISLMKACIQHLDEQLKVSTIIDEEEMRKLPHRLDLLAGFFGGATGGDARAGTAGLVVEGVMVACSNSDTK